MTATAEIVVTPFERIGGARAVRARVDRFYDAMDDDPAYAERRATFWHPSFRGRHD